MARRAEQERAAEHDLGTFIELHNSEYDRPLHLAPLLDALDRAMREPVFCLVEAPPQHGKTETFLQHIARVFRYRGRSDVAYCAYSAQLALRKSRRCRTMADAAGVWMHDEVIKRKNRFDTASAVSYWQTIDGGSFTAGGRGGGFTGGGYDFVLCDDLLKNRAEAESELVQKAAIEVVRSTFGNRINPGGSFFVTHQPWNDQDPIAQLKADRFGGDGDAAWELISLPAVANAVYDDDGWLIDGLPLWPARYSIKDLAKTKHRVKDYNWFSQYTLELRPRGKTIFGEPARYADPVVDNAAIVISCDPGIEDNKVRDSSGIVVTNCYARPSRAHTPERPSFDAWLDVLHAEDRWFDPGTLLDHLQHLQLEVYRGAPVIIEAVGAFKMLASIAAERNPKLQLFTVVPTASKYLRALPCSAAWNAGRVRVPHDSPWVAELLREARNFTGKKGGKDNMVDALSQAFDYAQQILTSWTVGADGDGERSMPHSPF